MHFSYNIFHFPNRLHFYIKTEISVQRQIRPVAVQQNDLVSLREFSHFFLKLFIETYKTSVGNSFFMLSVRY